MTEQVPPFFIPLVATAMTSGSACVLRVARRLSAKGVSSTALRAHSLPVAVKCMCRDGTAPPPTTSCATQVQCSVVSTILTRVARLKPGASGEERPSLPISPVPSHAFLPHSSLQVPCCHTPPYRLKEECHALSHLPSSPLCRCRACEWVGAKHKEECHALAAIMRMRRGGLSLIGPSSAEPPGKGSLIEDAPPPAAGEVLQRRGMRQKQGEEQGPNSPTPATAADAPEGKRQKQGEAEVPHYSPTPAAVTADPESHTTTLRLVLSMACFVARARRGGEGGSVHATAPSELTGDDDVLADSREELEGLMGDPGTDLPPSLQPKFEEACRLLKVGWNDNMMPAEGRLPPLLHLPPATPPHPTL